MLQNRVKYLVGALFAQKYSHGQNNVTAAGNEMGHGDFLPNCKRRQLVLYRKRTVVKKLL